MVRTTFSASFFWLLASRLLHARPPLPFTRHCTGRPRCGLVQLLPTDDHHVASGHSVCNRRLHLSGNHACCIAMPHSTTTATLPRQPQARCAPRGHRCSGPERNRAGTRDEEDGDVTKMHKIRRSKRDQHQELRGESDRGLRTPTAEKVCARELSAQTLKGAVLSSQVELGRACCSAGWWKVKQR